MTSHRKPVDQAVELMVYAPLGFALEARRLLPEFVARGRQQVQMARFVGRFAVQQGQHEAERRLAGALSQAESLLVDVGVRPAAPAPAPAADQAPVLEVVPDVVPAEVEAPARQSSAASSELAIADYDSLAASQVIPRLAGLSVTELEAVRAYEVGHRGRKTILGKISQLTGP